MYLAFVFVAKILWDLTLAMGCKLQSAPRAFECHAQWLFSSLAMRLFHDRVQMRYYRGGNAIRLPKSPSWKDLTGPNSPGR